MQNNVVFPLDCCACSEAFVIRARIRRLRKLLHFEKEKKPQKLWLNTWHIKAIKINK